MRKRSLIAAIAVSLCLGAALTVLVAFACSVWSPTTQTPFHPVDPAPPELAAVIPPQWLVRQSPDAPGSIQFLVREERGVGLIGLDFAVMEVLPGPDGGTSIDHISILRTISTQRAGWPLRSMEWEMSDPTGPSGIKHGYPVPGWLGPVRPAGLPGTHRMLPLKPIPGFALDTLLYAAVCFAAFPGIRLARRALRARKGCCPACGYSEAGLPSGAPCPECGSLPKAASA